MKNLKSLLFLLISSFVIFSCSNKNDDFQETITLSPSEIEAGPEGVSTEISVSANVAWTASVFGNANDWISISQKSGGPSDTRINITVAPNDGEEARSAEVRLFSANTYATVSVNQTAKPHDEEEDDDDGSATIAEIRAMYKGSDVRITDDISVKGVVISDFRRDTDGGLNNYTSAKSIVIQDETAGIHLRTTVDNSVFARGDEVEVNLKNQTISTYNGTLQINNLPIDNITKIGDGTIPAPKEISAAELLSGNYEGMYVAVRDVQVAEADLAKTFVVGDAHTSIGIVARSGEKFAIFTSKYAVFKDEKVPQGCGVLKGIAGVNVVDGVAEYQIVISAKSDYAALTGERFSTGKLFELPSAGTSVWGDKGEVEIEIAANVEWSAACVTAGVTVSPSEGNTTTAVKVSYGDNPSSEDSREIKVVFTTSDSDVSVKELVYTITQDPYEELVSDAVNKWMELPQIKSEENFAYVSNHIELGGESVRNYSIWYDTQNRVALWVAYPLYSSIIGSGSRTDDWGYDPKVPRRNQGVVFRSYGVEGYDRGHQLPSADRVSSDAANKTTFYFTNMTPQNSSLNSGVWAALESDVRGWARSCDTLYVVTGAILKTDEDPTIDYVQDNNGANVAVPKAYYKVLLRYDKSESANGGYSAIAFWYENRAYIINTPQSTEIRSVREVENLTGFNFFPNLDASIADVVETSKDGSSWGF